MENEWSRLLRFGAANGHVDLVLLALQHVADIDGDLGDNQTALLLATLGVYSVVSYLVTQRRQEIGVRIALGAQRSDVLGLVLRQGAMLAIVGIVVGAIGALFLTRLLKGLVFGVSTTDPIAFGGVMGLLIAVALIASWLPARRATRVDPMDVLRGT